MDYESLFNSSDYEHELQKERASKRRVCVSRYKKRLQRISRGCRHSCYGVYLKEDCKGDLPVSRYVRINRGKRSKYVKRMCNRSVRKLPLDYTPKSAGGYRRVADYWWELY